MLERTTQTPNLEKVPGIKPVNIKPEIVQKLAQTSLESGKYNPKVEQIVLDQIPDLVERGVTFDFFPSFALDFFADPTRADPSKYSLFKINKILTKLNETLHQDNAQSIKSMLDLETSSEYKPELLLILSKYINQEVNNLENNPSTRAKNLSQTIKTKLELSKDDIDAKIRQEKRNEFYKNNIQTIKQLKELYSKIEDRTINLIPRFADNFMNDLEENGTLTLEGVRSGSNLQMGPRLLYAMLIAPVTSTLSKTPEKEIMTNKLLDPVDKIFGTAELIINEGFDIDTTQIAQSLFRTLSHLINREKQIEIDKTTLKHKTEITNISNIITNTELEQHISITEFAEEIIDLPQFDREKRLQLYKVLDEIESKKNTEEKPIPFIDQFNKILDLFGDTNIKDALITKLTEYISNIASEYDTSWDTEEIDFEDVEDVNSEIQSKVYPAEFYEGLTVQPPKQKQPTITTPDILYGADSMDISYLDITDENKQYSDDLLKNAAEKQIKPNLLKKFIQRNIKRPLYINRKDLSVTDLRKEAELEDALSKKKPKPRK